MYDYKLMPLPNHDVFIWDMKTESEVPVSDPIYQLLKSKSSINIDLWLAEFNNLYQQWIEEDSPVFHDIKNEFNLSMIKALAEFNAANPEFKIAYWFDLNRELHGDIEWEKCPLSNTPLLDCGNEYHRINRLVSTIHPIVFPK